MIQKDPARYSFAHGGIMDDILLIDKPAGISSFGVIRLLRKRLGVRKMGHAGTLDPMASGLLIVGVGKGTKRLSEFADLTKTYQMRVLLGRRTTTGDITGEVIEERPPGRITPEAVRRVMAGMVGEIELGVPAYSAAKYRGQPRYRYARRGVAIPASIRRSRIYRLEFQSMRRDGDKVFLDAELEAEKGTYARAVAEEIGRRFGVPATLAALRRVRIGSFNVASAEKF
ncbi:MAG: tRNA pseudouridine(55) synthase TruB [Candidatus Sungbacteria bacterium]|uniref:tRNA pseudouridine synthase B n=1 Tax=Candidatus Sungiibacteriota bacterium TaxID=2750080 RepID=A0A933DT19_9BACT|nr:tRNA pseudouridine(55) synthase TruB [Candidatus Sungbacteria bacterium]